MMNLATVRLHDSRVMVRQELLDAGYDGSAIARMHRSGVLKRLRQGAYAEGRLWADLDSTERRRLMARAVLRNARSDAVLAGPSAADELGAPVWNMGDDVHLLRLDRRSGRRQAGVVQHRGEVLAGDVTIRHGIPISSGTRAAIDMIALADLEHALVTVNGLVRAGETSLELIRQRLDGMGQRPHLLKAPIALALIEPRCESAGETLTFLFCWRHHLPRPVVQVDVRNGRGRVVARVDFAWPELGVFLEFDGAEKYHRYRRPGESIEAMVLREKRREELICGLTGWRCIRIVWADLWTVTRTRDRLRATLAGERWTA